ncbi:MAG: methyl-accepting chemotaxis protein [Candidatus Nitrotoga sp.]
MRSNLPVTQNEIQLTDSTMIVSKTNLKGQITYVNKDFLDISGFTEAELINEPHNIVRHPDMPVEAFADLWATLKAGRPWVGIVKNRCKNGDYYWVHAHATPILENDQVIGYMSVRTMASREQITASEAAYRLFREKRAGKLRVQYGQARTGGQWMMKLADTSIRTKIITVMASLVAILIMVGVAGLCSIGKANVDLKAVYQDRVIPLEQINNLTNLIDRNRTLIMDELLNPSSENIHKKSAELEENIANVTTLWKAYQENRLSPEEKILADNFTNMHTTYIKDAVQSTQQLIVAGKLDEARAAYRNKVSSLNSGVREAASKLTKMKSSVSKVEFDKSDARYQSTLTISGLLMLAGALLAAIAGAFLIRTVRAPIVAATRVMTQATQGMRLDPIDISRNDELGQMLQVLESWMTRLGFETADIKRHADENLRIKIALDNVSTGVMITNAAREIIYANGSVSRILKGAELEIRKSLPNFNADKLIGVNIDSFHKNPKHLAEMLASLTKSYTAQLTIGSLRMQVIASPVINERNERLGSVAEWLDRTEEFKIEDDKKRVADEMARIKIALDNVSTGVMIANTEREIIYVNGSVTRILKWAESEIRKSLPNFNADKLIGVNIDSFHKNPKHQADMLATLNKAYTAQLKIGTRHMVVTANPVINAQNERLGSVAEWQDRTAEVRVEEEVATIVQGAQMGNFDNRVSMEGKEGFFKTLAEGLNSLAETTSNGLNDVARVLQAVAQGDLTENISADYSGIFGQLKDDTNATVERLREVIGRIKEASEAINIAAREISAGNTDLSSRTEEQASSLEETSSSMEELNSTVKQNAENANQANQLAHSSNDIAVKSGQMVQQIVSTMTGISDSSKKIADIIGVIDSIAFQTNILALNAAVEAARAGEQGRGFAVVATEVRNLAHRSATAAKEIKDLIVESGGKVDAGTKLVDQAGQSMAEVVSSFQQVTALVTDIANASREQSSGIEQVTQAVGQMDEVTQQNAALVEESAAAAESLEEQAHDLVQAVAMFKLAEDGGDSRRSLPAMRTLPAKKLAATPARPVTASASSKRLPSKHLGGDSDEEWKEF